MIRRLLPAWLVRCLVAWGVCAVATGVLLSTSGAASATEYAEIEGSGSTWAYSIVQQWIADVQKDGMQITFNNNGSSQGRKDFANYVTDFGDSDIPYQGIDPATHQQDTSVRPYAYLPVVAGGTSFTYQIKVAGKLVNNLRLSGETIAKIFTNVITNWDDPEITKDNNGHALPDLTIKPVVRSDGSGATAQFTLWMDNQYPSIWRPYNGAAGLTSLYPRKGLQIASNGDDGVMNTVDSAAGDGTIGYAEYSYPLNANYPVVYVENKAGYFVQPTQYNVAVALTKARIKGCNTQGTCNPKSVPATDYLTQDLDAVYSDKDPRTYPVSSYSYMIIPTSSTDRKMTSAKRQTLADFLTYALCGGQSQAGPYGYSPLPLNLVKAAFGQLEDLAKDPTSGAVTAGVSVKNPSANLATCDNPTFVKGNLAANHLAQIAPQPLSCQKVGEGPCGDTVVPPGTTQSSGASSGPSPGSGTQGGGGSGTGTSDPGTGQPGTGQPGTPGGTQPSIDPVTGQTIGGTGGTSAGGSTTAATANPVQIASSRSGDNRLFGWVSVLELIALVAAPGLFVAWRRRYAVGVKR